MRHGKMPTLTQTEEIYIKDNHGSTSVPDMAKSLGRGPATLYAYMKDKGLQVFKAPRKRWDGRHPFRVMNSKLEAVVKIRNIQNQGKPYQP